MRICKHTTCDKKHDSHGYCVNHARQFRRWGRIRTKAEQSAEISERAKRVKPALGKTWKIKDTSKMRGKHVKSEFKKGMTPWNKGLENWQTDAHKESARRANLGKTPWNKNKKMLSITGNKNWIWAGDKVSYRTLHKWVERHLGKPDTCTDCGNSGLTGRQIHWSNISGKYLRKLTDWQRLCAKCHKAYDKELKLTRTRG